MTINISIIKTVPVEFQKGNETVKIFKHFVDVGNNVMTVYSSIEKPKKVFLYLKNGCVKLRFE